MANTRRGLSRLRAGVPAVGELFSVVRELSFDALRDEAQSPPQLLLIGAERDSIEAIRDALAGGAGASFINTALVDELPTSLDDYDGIVLVNLSQAERNRPAIRQLLNAVETGGRTLTFQLPPTVGPERDTPVPDELLDDLRGRIVTRLAHRQLALGRYLPTFRKQAAAAIIGQTSRANAEFALLSNLPALIPLVGNLMAIGADSLVLTKNQLMLIYKLAALHGRDLDQPWRIYSEMLPVVGAGILWRTVAREMIALIPFAAGTIPKVIIAYAGTAVAGQAANFYYLQGKRPSSEQFKQFYARAAELARNLPLPARAGAERGNVIEGQFSEKGSTAAELPTSSPASPSAPVTPTSGTSSTPAAKAAPTKAQTGTPTDK
ncbi:MAG: hypothetical protein AVDCRST_MAG18-3032 [uncultured Thermomicrobiales bacterium]|uniref:DUF697 domain-containing protein n=1 Tax=uncultured Thermomicrobiales bacterium TaxID=1645740 RepID=A0A6J4VJM4_9BACT|nr:MAG: hypothetical protein AVDCRST_MAG18-3032 [uncultured Thermomicrobiales bacterium]